MSSNRRPRGRRPDRPDEDDFVETRAPRRDPRRRTPYTPQQRDTRPPDDDYLDDYLDEPGPQRQRRASRPQQSRPAQPTRGRTRAQQPRVQQFDYDVDDYLDDGYDDDRVIDTGRAPVDRGSRQRVERPSRRTRGASRVDPYEADEYADGDYDDSFDDGFIDEDDWYEEEAAAGGYRPRPRSSRSVPRPSISMPRPTMPKVSLPRPTVPVAVRQAALIQDRNSLVLAGVLVLSLIGMVIFTMSRVDTLAPSFATHISASGIKEDFRTENALWQLPLMAGGLLLMNLVLAWFFAQWSMFSARFMLVTSIIIQVVIWIALLRLAV